MDHNISDFIYSASQLYAIDDSFVIVKVGISFELFTELFTKLAAQNIEVKSLRNKANRLEELFLDLTGSNKK